MNPRYHPSASIETWHEYLLQISRLYRAELDQILIVAAKELSSNQIKEELKQELEEKNVRINTRTHIQRQRERDRRRTWAMRDVCGDKKQSRAPHHIETRDGFFLSCLFFFFFFFQIALDDYKFQLILLETCKSLFHLIEIFYLDPHLNVTSQLIDWIHRTLETPCVELSEDERNDEYDPHVMHDIDPYWSCIYRMILQGRLYEAIQLLETCEELMNTESEYYTIMRHIIASIESVPAIAYRTTHTSSSASSSSSSNIPLEQFLHSFAEWRRQVETIQTELDQQPHPHLELLVSILLGDETSLLECSGTNYLEYFISTLIFIKPTVSHSKTEMTQILSRCMEQCQAQFQQQQQQEQDGITDGDVDLYTPIDTLRYHIISSDITSALNVMNSMIDLRFFMAHVVNLLDSHGEILHMDSASSSASLDGGSSIHGGGIALRLNHSSINDSITLKEYYLIQFGESLESGSYTHGNGGGTEDLWLMACEYYAACHENGREYLEQLLKRQTILLTLEAPTTTTTNERSAFQTTTTTSPPIRPLRLLQTKKIHKLLSIASKYELFEVYRSILEMAGSTAQRLGREALEEEKSNTFFGQAAFWYAMMPHKESIQQQMVGEERINLVDDTHLDQGEVSRTTIDRLEGLVELLLDELLIKHDLTTSKRKEIAYDGLRGVLAHTPASLIRSIESYVNNNHNHTHTATATNPSITSPLLSFAIAYHHLHLYQQRRLETIRKILEEKVRLQTTSSSSSTNVEMTTNRMRIMNEDGDEEMSEETTHTQQQQQQQHPMNNLQQLLSTQEYCKDQSLHLLTSILTHAPTLLSSQRKYWLVLILELVDLLDSRRLTDVARQFDPSVTAVTESSISWYDLQHPTLSTTFSSLTHNYVSVVSSSKFSMSLLTHLQCLLTTLTLSGSSKLYGRTIGGMLEVKKLQQRLNQVIQKTIGRGE